MSDFCTENWIIANSKVDLCSELNAQLQKARREIADNECNAYWGQPPCTDRDICPKCQKPAKDHFTLNEGKWVYTCRLGWDVKPLNSFMPRCSCCNAPYAYHTSYRGNLCSKCARNRWR